MYRWIEWIPMLLVMAILAAGCSSSGNRKEDAGPDDGRNEDGGDTVDGGDRNDAVDGWNDGGDGGDGADSGPVTSLGCPFPFEPIEEHTFQDPFGNETSIPETHIVCAIDYEDVQAQIMVKAVPIGLTQFFDFIYEAREAFVCRDGQVEALPAGTFSYEFLHHGWEKMTVAFDGYKYLFDYRDWCVGYRPCNPNFEIYDVRLAADDTLVADDRPAVCSRVTQAGNPRPLVPQARIPATGVDIVFSMGSDSGDPDEAPVHTVTLSPIRIDVHEATHADFLLFLNDHGNDCDGRPCVDTNGAGVHFYREQAAWKVEAGYEDVPVVQISWHAADEYCRWRQWLSLPTEAQWEMAGSSEGTRLYPWGDDLPTCNHANFSDCQSSSPDEVCTRQAGHNREGVCDLAGNVAEWLYDWYDAGYYDNCVQDCRNPRGPTDPTGLKAIRGGGFSDPAAFLRSTDRDSADPSSASERIGVRCTGRAGQPHNP